MAKEVRAKDKPELNLDNRPRAAVYSTLHSQRAQRAIVLLHAFCAVNGLRCVFYLDKRKPKEGQPSGWQCLLDDISQGKFDMVITWLEAPGMAQFCEEYHTHFEQVDPFVYSQSMREGKIDLRHTR